MIDFSEAAKHIVRPSEAIIYTLPDALWYASLLCFQRPLHRNVFSPVTVLACLTAPLHELLQLSGVVPGTFCPYDLGAYLSILFIYLFICFYTCYPK